MNSQNLLAALALGLLLSTRPLSAVEDFSAAANPSGPRAAGEAERAIKSFTFPKGFHCELVAAEPLLANPVSFTIDAQGRFYVAETYRIDAGVMDIRSKMNWLNDELASTSVSNRIAYTRSREATNLLWWTTHEDRVVQLTDTNNDGKLDQSKVFAGGFNQMADGIGAGVLARGDSVYYTCIPNLWLLTDTNHDGVADVRTSLSYGYGVRGGYSGHDLHGLQIGPDGRLYFSIGDRGAHIELPNGKTVSNPETGAIYRCDLDGNNLEIFHLGLRNPQELTFDDYGNLWTVDNNSDAGDPARIVYLVEGGDSGWRIGWQFQWSPILRGSWLGERLCYEEFPGRAAYCLPPVSDKVSNGPSGLTYDPGVGLPERWRGHFFLCNFGGNPSPNSGVFAFTVKPRGAGFALGEVEKFWWDILTTDVDFGYDGCMYVTDWIGGWKGAGAGRIYRLFEPAARQQAEAAQVKQLFAAGFTQRPVTELLPLLAHADRRVRREAQFALVAQNAGGELAEVAAKNSSLLARLHAIWGLGQLMRQGKQFDLAALLQDPQPEVRVQAARIIADAKDGRYEKELLAFLTAAEPRVRYFGAFALSKVGRAENLPAILTLLRRADTDAWLRHAGVLALLQCATETQLAELRADKSATVRLAAVIALRRLASPQLEQFLADTDPLVVAEAARAINDLPIAAALPRLAALADNLPALAKLPGGTATAPGPRDAIIRRVINANYRLGDEAAAVRIARLAAATKLPEDMRLEALSALPYWAKPDGKDRITAHWRPVPARPMFTAPEVATELLTLVTTPKSEKLALAAFGMAEKMKWAQFEPPAYKLVKDKTVSPSLRVAALQFLPAANSPNLKDAVKLAWADRAEPLRLAAFRIGGKSGLVDLSIATLEPRLQSGSVAEQQLVYSILADPKKSGADELLAKQLDRLVAGKIPGDVKLDLLEAAAKHQTEVVKAGLERFAATRPSTNGLTQFTECLTGGNPRAGRSIFNDKIEASCVRCHKINKNGGDAGPDLSKIGAAHTREYILESILYPNAHIAPGYENVQGTLKNGLAFAGLVKKETADTLEILSPEDGPMKIKKSDIATRKAGPSGMLDNFREVLSKRELRDLVQFLATQK